MKAKVSIISFIKITAFLLSAIIVVTSCKKQNIDNDSGSMPEEPGVVITDPLCFTAEDSRISIEMDARFGYDTVLFFEYSYDNVVWNRFIPNYTIAVLAHEGDKVYFRGHNPQGLSPNLELYDENNYYLGEGVRFRTNFKETALSGNIMSLIDTVFRDKPLPKNCFAGLFINTYITSAPELPATKMGEYCYSNMFYGCSRLKTCPNLPATNLAKYCYEHMFFGCSQLANVPILPATTLVEGCYKLMFTCCTNLSGIKVYFTDWYNGATLYWLEETAEYGTFYCPRALSQEFGTNKIPDYWIVEPF